MTRDMLKAWLQILMVFATMLPSIFVIAISTAIVVLIAHAILNRFRK